MEQYTDLPRQLRTNQVLIRFGLRIIILLAFAACGSMGFGRSLAALLSMTIILCTAVGTIRREAPFDVSLNHWDEVAAYTALFCLVNGLSPSAPA
ncbi:hypothetical protein [Bradyrhizobium sp.]|uniref:hypothetical protein n=1 Tax=Bradyrhizobium sp. TaxID=376 RepID=UPI003C340627